eukprot:TRINITY_DN77360_c0_g1_i1.p1 TRINITY_DN77360_c0_g1~~TRINITY_DN77360_c0_g1_i1.p1  ORF type:complete len:353 (+),score=61.12 TRINITY_DN77360_c0_g1_i1:65-1123(+)
MPNESISGEVGYCASFKDCATCNSVSDSSRRCGWCASSSMCVELTPSLKAKLDLEGVVDPHVFYNNKEFQKTYGPSAVVNPYYLTHGNECLIWVTRDASCAYVEDYCGGLVGCNNCVKRSGCGFCRHPDNMNGECRSGSKSQELGFSRASRQCGQNAASEVWVFGDWSRYLSGHSWRDVCTIRSTDISGSHGTYSPYEAGEDQSQYYHTLTVALCVCAFLFLMLLSLATAIFYKVHATNAAVDRGAPRAVRASLEPPTIALSTMEAEVPGFLPTVIGARQATNEDAEGGRTNDACAVCLADFDVGDRIRTLPCQHAFHKDCIDAWLRSRIVCPVCRQAIMTSSCVEAAGARS